MASRKFAAFLFQKTFNSMKSTTVTSLNALPCATWCRLHVQPRSWVSGKKFSSSVPKPQKQTVTVIFIDRDGDRIETEAQVGDTLLDVAQKHDVELEGTGKDHVNLVNKELYTFKMSSACH
ncbi:hypothetical protein RRG08_052000 [Elysia crispata]|uniref:Uncharacterized protein n=1 Tax=Elysia crispata TaxID=231223 RepID=A0AAE0ZEE6_9GAST|nr:hypothetical protein RRG08_052000 [Elysia crispata]